MLLTQYSELYPNVMDILNDNEFYYNYNVVETDSGYEYTPIRIYLFPTIDNIINTIAKAVDYTDETSLYDYLILNPDDEGATQLMKSIREDVEVRYGNKKIESPIESARKRKLNLLMKYDSSSEVNSFYLNGMQVWLDKATRVGLMNSLNILLSAGTEESTLWFDSFMFVINTEAAIQMLRSLEIYAIDCYNKTAEHRSNLLKLTSEDSILNYDYTTGYPNKLEFTIE